MESKMAIPSNGVYTLQLESHEDRIQTIEGTLQEVGTTVTEIKVKQEFVAKRHDEQFAQIIEKLDSAMDVIAQRLHWVTSELEKSEKTTSSIKTKVLHIEEEKTNKLKRLSSIKKLAVPLLLACGGVLAGKFGEVLWTWMTR
jgi:chromosome segregation ATPase